MIAAVVVAPTQVSSSVGPRLPKNLSPADSDAKTRQAKRAGIRIASEAEIGSLIRERLVAKWSRRNDAKTNRPQAREYLEAGLPDRSQTA